MIDHLDPVSRGVRHKYPPGFRVKGAVVEQRARIRNLDDGSEAKRHHTLP
jgi:hypothetical protein